LKNKDLLSPIRVNGKKKKERSPEKIYYSPADSLSKTMQYVGLALRTLVLYIGVLGITSFICGAAGLTHSDYFAACVVSPWSIALLSLPVALAAAFASVNSVCAIAAPFLYSGITIGVYAIAYGNPFDFIVKSALRIYNYFLYNLSSLGYYSFGDYMIRDGYDYTTAEYATYDPYRFAGAFLLASLIGFVLYFCVQRKTRLFPVVILLTAVFAPILTYNIAVGTSGIAFIIVFVLAAVSLKIYDHRYAGRAEKIMEHKKRKLDKKEFRAKKRIEKKKAKADLRKEADRVYDKAIDADIPHSKAKKAKKAVFKAHKEALKQAKKDALLNAKLEKKKAKADKKEQKQRLSELKKALKSAKSSKDQAGAESIAKEISAVAAGNGISQDEKKSQRLKARKEKKENRAKLRRISMAGGYAGFGVALAAFLAVWLPMSVVSGPFLTIDPLNDRIQTIRAYVTAYLRGSDVDLNDTYVYGLHELTPRALTFDPLKLDEDLLFRVDAWGKSNVYLRSWTATEFDWENDTWLSADYNEVHEYRDLFGKNFTPDSIKTDFYSYVFPSSAIIEDENTYKNFTSQGFTVQQIDVWRVKGASLLIFVPSGVNSDLGILKYKSTSPTSYKYRNYFEGIYSSFYYSKGKGYSTVSYIPAYNRADVSENIAETLAYYNAAKDIIINNPSASGDEADALCYSFQQYCAENKIEFQGTSLVERYYLEMSAKEQKELIDSFKTEEKYREYVLENYTAKTENETIAQLSGEIMAEALLNDSDGTLSAHEAAMAVVGYLREGFTYTKEPDDSLAVSGKPVIETFLTDVKEGYCSHFASAAVALLQESGIPARYVEGYIASNFESMGTEDSINRASVYGTDAHAWIEVYTDGMGWMTYEVTPGDLSDDMYDPNSDTIDPIPDVSDPSGDEHSPGFSQPIDPPVGDIDIGDLEIDGDDYADIEDDGKKKSDLTILFIILIVIAGLALLGFLISLLVRFIRKRAWEAMNARYSIIDAAKNNEEFTAKDRDNHAIARQLNDWIMEIYSVIDCQPRPGEVPSEFIQRMRDEYGNLSHIDVGEVIEAMQKEEFGHGLNYGELNALAEYLEDMIASVYAGLNPWQKLITRYFKRKI